MLSSEDNRQELITGCAVGELIKIEERETGRNRAVILGRRKTSKKRGGARFNEMRRDYKGGGHKGERRGTSWSGKGEQKHSDRGERITKAQTS